MANATAEKTEKTEKLQNTEKLKALRLTMDKIDKDFGKGSVMMMNERAERLMEVISTESEEHTSELQSHVNLVCRLLLEKKKKKKKIIKQIKQKKQIKKLIKT